MHPQEPQSHGPGAPSFSARLQAATTLTGILSRHNIPHAFIGGFAFNLLGTSRSTLDIDLIIEDSAFSPGPSKPPKAQEPSKPPKAQEPIHQIRQLLVESDERFCLVGSGVIPKLIFTAQTEEESPVRVPVETLRAGSLGLPQHIGQVMTVRGIPILPPRFLLLTKLKRCTNFLGSDRPKSVARFKSDEGDIKHLLKWLVEENERVDVKGYCHGSKRAVDDNEWMKTLDNLIHKVGELVRFWKEKGDGEKETVAGLQKVMEEEDWRRVVERLEHTGREKLALF